MVRPRDDDARDTLAARGFNRCRCGRHAARKPEGYECGEVSPAPPVSRGEKMPATRNGAARFRATPTRRRWQDDEAALYAMLDAAGYLSIEWMEQNADAGSWILADLSRVYVRQYPWGAYLKPPRRFSSDAGFLVARLLVEVDGGAHAAGRRKVRSDTERRGLAAAAGWRVLALTPEQVRDGSAVQLVASALAVAPRAPTSDGGGRDGKDKEGT